MPTVPIAPTYNIGTPTVAPATSNGLLPMPNASNSLTAPATSGQAPTGSRLNAKGNFVDVSGNQYTRAPVDTTPTLTANVTSLSQKPQGAPASINSNTAKTDFTTKTNTLNELHQNANEQATTATNQPTPDTTQASSSTDEITKLLSELDNNLSTTRANESSQLGDTSKSLEETQAAADTAAHEGFNKLQSISAGTYPLSPVEKQLIEATKQSYQRVLQSQAVANSGAVGKITELMASLGIQHSAPLESMSFIQATISRGTSRLADITSKMTNAVNNLQMKMRQNDFTNMQSAYRDVAKSFKERTDTISKMQSSLSKAANNTQTQMINNARLSVDAIVSSNKATALQKRDAARTAYESGMLSEKKYSNITARINATKVKAAKPLTQKEIVSNIRTEASNKFVQGKMFKSGSLKGTPIIDSNGFMQPNVWKFVIKKAQEGGMQRNEFIKSFGNYVYADRNNLNTISNLYGLTPSEVKIIQGQLPLSS